MNRAEMIVEFHVENASNICLSEEWNKPGVWIAYGKSEEDVDYICLEVGQTSNIKNELENDFKLLVKEACKDGVKVRCFRKWSKLF